MKEPTSFMYGGYELRCQAKAVGGGRFAPVLVVSKLIWPTRPREIDVPREYFESPQTAIDAAHARGVEWVENYG